MTHAAPVKVLFWFDVEDYLTPESDDALLRLLQCFENQGVQATWKVVAEKARTLEERDRQDVIRALQRQDIGYHTDSHSQHPVLAEYLRDAGWDDGVEEVIRRERPGYEDLVRILGPASTFGQAGGSWAPQLYPFLRDAGIPLFMDEAGHIGLDGEPFWYCNVPHINRMGTRCTRMEFTRGEQGLADGIARFDAIRADTAAAGGGLISIFYHPCEFATTAFWDGVNFGGGRQPPRPEWIPAPLRPPGQMAAGVALFERYLAHIVAQTDVEVLTGRQILNLLPDEAAGRVFSLRELAALLHFPARVVEHRFVDASTVLAPSELFALAVDALTQILLAVADDTRGTAPDLSIDPDALQVTVDADTPLGPVRRQACMVAAAEPIPTDVLLGAAVDAHQFLRHHGRLPDAVWLGSQALSPADLLVTAGALLQRLATASLSRQAHLPTSVPLRQGHLGSERHVGEDALKLAIFSEDFNAPGLVELARLQAWTLKPAIRLPS